MDLELGRGHVFMGGLLALAAACAGCVTETAPQRPYSFAVHVSDASPSFDQARFRSFRKDGRLVAHVSMDEIENRLSLIPPLPSRLDYVVRLGTEPKLRFAIGVSALGSDALAMPVDFRVLVAEESSNEATEAFADTVLRRFPNQWFEQEVDLRRWARRTVTISFETNARETEFTRSRIGDAGQTFLPAWGNPTLEDRAAAPERPNLILVSIDCLRADHVSVYGHDRGTTPSLDRFAKDALVFERAYAVSSWTLPTHMSMLTGLMPTQHGLTRARERDPATLYLPSLLSESGYETVGIVSGLYLTPKFGFEEGFDVYQSRVDVPATELVNAALEILTDGVPRERFLFLHFFDAHWPYLPPDELRAQVDVNVDISDAMQKAVEGAPPETGEVEALKALYDAEVSYVDRELGRFFDALRDAGLYHKSLIIVTSDHGEGFYEHGLWQHSDVAYDEVLHIPLLVKWPESSGGRSDTLVSQLHIFPTLMKAAGLPSPYAEPDLAKVPAASKPRQAMSEITWEENERHGASMKIVVRRDGRKYIATFGSEKGSETPFTRVDREELYDLTQDPGEMVNVLEDDAGDVAAFRREARAYIEHARQRRADQAGSIIRLDDELQERLRALGYVNP